jgi:elongation factor Ts
MNKVNAKLVAAVRAATGAALHTCKRALEEAKGNVQAAIDVVKNMGYAVADKKSDRVTSQGCIVGQVVHLSGEGIYRGAMLECQSETDFVSTNEVFLGFAKQVLDLALQSEAKTLDELLKSSLDNTQTVEQARQALVGQVGENVRISRYQVLETKDHLGLYVHKGRYGCIVALKGPRPDIAKDIAVHVVVSHPGDVTDLLSQEFYKDPSKRVEIYLKENNSEVLRYIYFMLGSQDNSAD